MRRGAPRWSETGLARELAARLTDWQTVLQGQPVLARQILRKLPVGRLRLTPQPGCAYAWTGQASYGRLLAGLIGVQSWVPSGRR